jgi:hypothetical protein
MFSAPPLPVRRGERFGSLVACLPLARLPRGRLWACKCDCGRWCSRGGQHLRYTKRNHGESACGECNREARRGSYILGREERAMFFAALWADKRTLYTSRADERISEAVLGELVEEFGELPPDAPPSYSVSAAGSRGQPGTGPDISVLYPLDGRRELQWECQDCREVCRLGFACVGCIEFVCVACVRDGHHPFHGRNQDTLASIGREWDVGAECIRKIEGKALRKLREAHRAAMLEDTVREDVSVLVDVALARIAREALEEARTRAILAKLPMHHGALGAQAR